MLLFTQFKNSFFRGVTFINCFRIFKWIVRGSLLHKVHGVHKQIGIDVQINNLQTRGVEITLIQCCFNVTTLKQRWTNVISTPCLQGIYLETCQENIHNKVQGCNLCKITKFTSIALHLLKLPKLPKSVIPVKHLWIVVLAILLHPNK